MKRSIAISEIANKMNDVFLSQQEDKTWSEKIKAKDNYYLVVSQNVFSVIEIGMNKRNTNYYYGFRVGILEQDKEEKDFIGIIKRHALEDVDYFANPKHYFAFFEIDFNRIDSYKNELLFRYGLRKNKIPIVFNYSTEQRIKSKLFEKYGEF